MCQPSLKDLKKACEEEKHPFSIGFDKHYTPMIRSFERFYGLDIDIFNEDGSPSLVFFKTPSGYQNIGFSGEDLKELWNDFVKCELGG